MIWTAEIEERHSSCDEEPVAGTHFLDDDDDDHRKSRSNEPVAGRFPDVPEESRNDDDFALRDCGIV